MLGGVRVLLQQLLDRLRNELGQLALELLHQLQALPRFLEVLQSRGQIGVLPRQVRISLSQPARHLVEGGAELPELVAGGQNGPSLEVTVAYPTGRGGQHRHRADHDPAHGHREHGGRGDDGQPGDEDLAVAKTVHLREHRPHRRRDLDDGPYLVVTAVAALAPLLIGDGMQEDEQRDPVSHVHGFLRLPRLHHALEQRAGQRGRRRPLHLADIGHHRRREIGVLPHLLESGQIGEGLDSVAPVDHQALDGRRLLELLDHRPGDVRPLLQHGAFDAGHDRLGEVAGGHLVLLHEQRGFAPDGPDRGGAEADDENQHDEDGDFHRQPQGNIAADPTTVNRGGARRRSGRRGPPRTRTRCDHPGAPRSVGPGTGRDRSLPFRWPGRCRPGRTFRRAEPGRPWESPRHCRCIAHWTTSPRRPRLMTIAPPRGVYSMAFAVRFTRT